MAKTASKAKAAASETITLPVLGKGEHNGGLILEKGVPAHWVILLPGNTTGTWSECVEWAKKQGGELPTRREQSVLFANAKEHFEERWYWSGEQRAGGADYAWGQYFGDGDQGYDGVSDRLRARAVRRVPIQ